VAGLKLPTKGVFLLFSGDVGLSYATTTAIMSNYRS